jgi:hypothetical protein
MCRSRPETLRHLPLTNLKIDPRLLTAQTRLVMPESTTVNRFLILVHPGSAKIENTTILRLPYKKWNNNFYSSFFFFLFLMIIKI